MIHSIVYAEQIATTQDSIEQDFLSKQLVEWLVTTQEIVKQKRYIILRYCDVLLHTDEYEQDTNVKGYFGFQQDDFVYDPRQSAFLYALCVHIDESSKGKKTPAIQKKSWQYIVNNNASYRYRNYKEKFDKDIDYANTAKVAMTELLKQNLDLSTLWWIPPQASLDAGSAYTPCDPVTSMQDCNFSRFLPDIFATVINDYANVRLGAAYGYQLLPSWTGADTQEAYRNAIAKFSRTFFWDDAVDNLWKPIGDASAPCNDPDIWYLYPDDLEGDRKHCSHPKTYKFVEGTIKSAEKLLKKTKMFDGKKLLSDETACNQPDRELLKCAFAVHSNSSQQGDPKVFKNLLLNELYRYNMFVSYYTKSLLLYESAYYPLTIGSVSFGFNRAIKEQKNMLAEQQLAQQAIRQVLRMIDQVSVYYPIHVWLAAYHEDLLNYRKTITSAYTPLHQLNYKFRNVQECQE